MSDLAVTGPLAHLSFAERTRDLIVSVEERGPICVLDLRLGPKDTAAAAALGFDLPTEPRTAVTAGDVTCLWFSIDQWLIVAPRDAASGLAEGLRGALEGKSHALTDVSDMRAVLRISGDATRMVLAKCCPIDVFAEDFRPGFVRRLSFGEIAAAIHVVSAEPVTVDLYVFRSYADYALDWLTEAAGSGRAVALFGKTEAPKI